MSRFAGKSQETASALDKQGSGEQNFADMVERWSEGLAAAELLDAPQQHALRRAVSEARAGRLENPPPPLLTILLLGATGGGKSALLNALAGAEIARSHHLRPTTSQPTVYLHEDVAPARLFEYGVELGNLAGGKAGSGNPPSPEVTAETGEAPARKSSLRLHSREDLRNKVLIDAPDIDSYRTEHRDLVMQLLPVVDIVLYVVTPFSYKDDIGWEIIQRERGRRAFAFVMNKWDNEGMPRLLPREPGPDADFGEMVQQRAGYGKARIFLTSAQSHLPAPQNQSDVPTPAEGENFAELKEWLEQGLSTSKIEQIQRRRRRSLWAALAGAIMEALPPQVDLAAVYSSAERAVADLPAEGKGAWAVLIERRAEALARRREEEGRPHSPGPFGRLSALFSAAINAGASWRKIAQPRPDVAPEELDAATGRSAEILASRLSCIERIFRDHHLPGTVFHDRTAELIEDVPQRLRSVFHSQSERIIDKLVSAWRMGLGWAVLVIFELLSVGLFGLAAWRLVEAFLSAQYLDLRFTLNLFALLLLLLSAGSAVMALLFPPVKNRMRRDLSAVIASEWQDISAEALIKTKGTLKEIEHLRESGEQLAKVCNSHISEITDEMRAVEDGETDRLFA